MKECIFKNIKIFTVKNTTWILFFSFLFLYITCGLYLTFFNDQVVQIRHDLIYNLDSGRLYTEFSSLHQRRWLHSHPFASLIYQSLFSMFNDIFHSPRATVLIIQSFLGASGVVLLHRIFKLLNIRHFISISLTLLFGFSFSMLIFCAIPEVYALSGFLQALMLYFTIFVYKSKEKISVPFVIAIFTLLIILTFGVNLITIISAFILVGFLIFSQNNTFTTQKAKTFLKTFAITILSILIFSAIHKMAFPIDGYFFDSTVKSIVNKTPHSTTRYISKKFSIKNVHFALRGSFVEPFYALKTEIIKIKTLNLTKSDITDKKPKWIISKGLEFCSHQKLKNFIPIIMFFGLTFIYFLKNRKIYKENYPLLLCLFSIILINTIFNTFFCNRVCFLYSLNFLIYLFVLLGIIQNIPENKVLLITNCALLLWQIPINFSMLHFIEKFVRYKNSTHHSLDTYILWAFLSVLIIGFVIFILKKLVKEEFIEVPTEKKYLYGLLLFFIYMIIFAIFMTLFNGRV